MCLAIPGRILDTIGDEPMARKGRVSFGGVVKEVSLAYLPDARVDQYVIVHAGFAISVVDEAEAQKTIEAFQSAGLLDDDGNLAGEDHATGEA